MTIAALLLTLAVSDAPDPCRDPGPAADPADPVTAAIYHGVGDDERAGGNAAAARFANREALRLDASRPSDDMTALVLGIFPTPPADHTRINPQLRRMDIHIPI